MSRNQINVYLAAILTTLADLATDCAESTVYLALGMDLSKYQTLRGLLVAGKLVTINGHRIALTDAGREIAAKCNAVAAARH